MEVTQQGGVTIVRIAHGKANAMDTELCDAVTAAFERLQAEPYAPVVMIGSGGVFSAGVNLLRIAEGGAAYLAGFLPSLGRMFETVFRHSRPVVAAVNGHAIAGGCILACAADRRLMAPGPGRIGITEMLVGVPFPGIALEIMRFASAPQHFQRLVYGGATYDAAAAVGLGMVEDVIDADALLERAIEEAQTLAAVSPAAFELTKRQLRAPVWERVQATRDVDAQVFAVWAGAEAQAAIGRYVERTLKRSTPRA